MLKLQFLDNRQPSMWLVDQRLSIGRDKTNSLVINDEGVSVFHAELRQEDGKLYIWDSGSVNGTFLNGEKITGKREVKAGDVIRFHLIDVQIVDPSKGPAVLPEAVKRDLDKPAQPLWQIKAMTGTTSGKMHQIDGTKVIGRDPGCDIMVTGAHVSRRHAEFSLRSGQLWVKDLGSSNGTFVNGKRNDEVALKNGDEVKFDAMTFKVVGPAGAAADEGFDEADMTQFRPAVSAKPAAAPKPAPAPVAAPRPVAAPASAPILASVSIAPKPAAPASAPLPLATAQSVNAGGLGPLVLIVLVVLAAVAGFFIFK